MQTFLFFYYFFTKIFYQNFFSLVYFAERTVILSLTFLFSFLSKIKHGATLTKVYLQVNTHALLENARIDQMNAERVILNKSIC